MRIAERRVCMVIMALLILAPGVFADTVTLTATSPVTVSHSTVFQIVNFPLVSGVAAAGFIGPQSVSSPFLLSLGSLALPAGSTLQSATLSFSFSPVGVTLPSIPSLRSVSPTQAVCGNPFNSFPCSFSAATLAVGSIASGFTSPVNLGVGTGNLSLAGYGSTTSGIDLLAGGFGLALLNGGPVNLGGNGIIFFNSPNLQTPGFNAITNLNLKADYSFQANGTLTVNYLPPAPVPEPATLVLFGTGLVGLATAIRRKIS